MSYVHAARAGWTSASLGEILRIRDHERVPVNAKEREARRGSIPYYGATGQVGWIDDYLFDEELILLGEDGAPFLQPRAKAYLIRGKAWVNNHAHVLEALGGTPAAFWKHQLDQVNFRPYVSGTTRLKLSQAPMRRIPLFVPPGEEQQRIVEAIDSYFSRLDDATATLQRVQANLKRYRASVLKSAVEGRLVPTEADLARQEGRDYEPADVLLRRILKERRRRWEEAELEKIVAKGKQPENDKWKAKYKEPAAPDTEGLPGLPEGWCWASTDQLFWFVTSGSRGWAKYYSEAGPTFIRIGNLDHGSISLDLSDVQRVSAPTGAEGTRTRVEAGDILVSITADVGMIALVPPALSEAYINQHVSLARPVPGPHMPFLAWFLAADDGGQRQFQSLQRGATKVGLGLDDIRNVIVPFPPLSEQVRVEARISELLSCAEDVRQSVSASKSRGARLRQSILKWAFEGKLVDQNPNDEPASVLLERILAQREAAASRAKPKNRAHHKRKAKS